MVTYDLVVPTFNRGWALPRLLESVEAQSALPSAIIVSDAGSIDNTEEIVQHYFQRIPSRNLYLKHDGPELGIVDNWIRGIQTCTSPWVKILWSDDWLLPNGAARLVEAADHTGVAVLGGIRIQREGNSEDLCPPCTPPSSYAEAIALFFRQKLPITPSATLLRTEDCIEALSCPNLPEICRKSGVGPDLAMTLWPLIQGSQIATLDDPVVVTLDHSSSITRVQRSSLAAKYAVAALRLQNDKSTLGDGESNMLLAWIADAKLRGHLRGTGNDVPSLSLRSVIAAVGIRWNLLRSRLTGLISRK